MSGDPEIHPKTPLDKEVESGKEEDMRQSSPGTALSLAAFKGNRDMVSLLLDRKADINIVGGEYGTALGAAAYRGEENIVSLLLDKGAGINIAGGAYGTALGAAASRPENEGVVKLLLGRGADINIISGKYGTALVIAASRPRNEKIVRLLLDEGADINVLGGKYGTALGAAAYFGQEATVSLLLARGADVIRVGGFYETAEGEYPTVLDAARSGGAKASTDLLARLDSTVKMALQRAIMDESTTLNPSCNNAVAGRPPFPMPYRYTRSIATTSTSHHQQQAEASTDSPFPTAFQAGESITPQQADFLCKELNEEMLIRSLVSLVGIHGKAAKRLQGWIQNDIRYFVSQNLDFGLAYAAARVGWKHFNEATSLVGEEDAFVTTQRDRWLKKVKELDVERAQAIYMDLDSGRELIKKPYSVMPRRIWDLKSNRVIEYRILHSEVQSVEIAHNATNTNLSTESRSYLTAPFWAVTHSWTQDMKKVETPINQYQWPVPLPEDVKVHDLRAELLNFGAEYIWLDVMCLRQESAKASLEILRQDEWKLDVPTIGNIYRAAKGLVRYFNGLGRPFSNEKWDDPRHWLRRAWTLQEIRPEDMTLNGGASLCNGPVFMNIEGNFGGNEITLRRAIQPVVELASQLEPPSRCTIYQLAREMANRVASNPTDKVCGLFYLLGTNILPTYDETVGEEHAWKQCFHVLPFGKKLEILFDFPYRGRQWFPTWNQLMEWPKRDPDCMHPPIGWPQKRRIPETKREDRERFFIPDAWAISNVLLHATTKKNEYQLGKDNKVIGVYGPYLSQTQIEVSGQEFTIVVLSVADFSNLVVCKQATKQRQRRKSGDGTEKLIEVTYLQKIGVLRTDDGHELRRDMVFENINCLFV